MFSHVVDFYHQVFDANRANGSWKDPVNVNLDVMECPDLISFCRAIEFFHGVRPRVTPGDTSRSVRVTSPGYSC